MYIDIKIFTKTSDESPIEIQVGRVQMRCYKGEPNSRLIYQFHNLSNRDRDMYGFHTVNLIVQTWEGMYPSGCRFEATLVNKEFDPS